MVDALHGVKIVYFENFNAICLFFCSRGANIPSLNDLLAPYGISFSDKIFNGEFSIGENSAYFGSGSIISEFPAGGLIIPAILTDQVRALLSAKYVKSEVPIIGL